MTSFQQVRDGFGEQGQVRAERLLNVKGSQVQILSARLTGSDSPRGSEPFFTRSVDSSRRRRGPAATDHFRTTRWRMPVPASSIACTSGCRSGAQRFEDRHGTASPALGLLRHEATSAGICLTPDVQEPAVEVEVTHLEPGDLADPERGRRQEGDDVSIPWCPPASTTRSANSSKVETSGNANSRGLLGSWSASLRPTVLRRARSLAGLRAMMPSRTASSRTSTRAETVFLTVERCVWSPTRRSRGRPTRRSSWSRAGGRVSARPAA